MAICRLLHRRGLSHKEASRPPNNYGRRSPERVICGSTGASGLQNVIGAAGL
jgi:hypothetical protein